MPVHDTWQHWYHFQISDIKINKYTQDITKVNATRMDIFIDLPQSQHIGSKYIRWSTFHRQHFQMHLLGYKFTKAPLQPHDDFIKWKHFPRYWPFVRGIHRSPGTGEFPAQKPVTRSFDVFFNLRLNKWLSKQWWGWWFETLSCPLWRHCSECGLPHLKSREVSFARTIVSQTPSRFEILHRAQQYQCRALCILWTN